MQSKLSIKISSNAMIFDDHNNYHKVSM